MMGSWNQFIREMKLGQMLCEAHTQALAHGFHGKNKGVGFKAFCLREGIPLRRAYRCMQRYKTVLGIVMGGFLSGLPIDDKSAVTKAPADLVVP